MDIFRKYLGTIGQHPQGPDEVTLKGNGRYACPIVGESFHQEALEQICGGRTEDGAEHKCTARLILEDSNPHDDQAVRVDINGQEVGHLGRDVAREFRAQLKRSGHPRPTLITCNAVVRGGWDRPERGGKSAREASRGHFGVQLDIPTDKEKGPPA